MMLHQRNRRRGAADDDDPTTTVYGTSGSANGSGAGGSSYVGYGGMGGGSASSAAGSSYASYGGLGSRSAVGGGFKDKGKRKKENIFWQKLQDPLFLVSLLAILFFMTAVRYKLQHQHAKPKNEESVFAISRKVDSLEKELKTSQEAYKRQMKENARLQADLMKLKKTKPDAARLQEEANVERTKMEAREGAWKVQFEKLREAVQKEARRSVIEKYGQGPHFCEFAVIIPDDHDDEYRTFTVQMAPLELMPHAVHLFLEQVSHRLWDDSWFYLNGPHVLQAGPQVQDTEEHEVALENGADERELALKPFRKLQLDSMAFPEYSDEFPHVPWTLGYTGRPGGPDFYINKVDNTKTHGPGGQTHHDLVENADPCFAKVVDGMATLELITKTRTIQDRNEFQFFFDEPIEIIRVRVVPDPFKPKVEEKTEEKGSAPVATAWQHSEDSKAAQQNEDSQGRVEITHGDVVSDEQQQNHEERHTDLHQMHRHRKHPHADFLPNESVEA